CGFNAVTKPTGEGLERRMDFLGDDALVGRKRPATPEGRTARTDNPSATLDESVECRADPIWTIARAVKDDDYRAATRAGRLDNHCVGERWHRERTDGDGRTIRNSSVYGCRPSGCRARGVAA